ncbi:MAG: M14 family zinc carboxypeptidase [Rubricoccaceae bacterium]
MRLPLLAALVLSLSLATARAQPAVPLTAPFAAPGTTAYDAAIPTPEAVLGFQIGARHTRPDEVVTYFEAVARASDRVTLGEHGRTHDGRRLIHAIVTRPGRDLEAARRANLRLSDEPGAVSEAALAALPVVAYMGYSVHGDEASGTDAALVLLYHLAAGQGPAVDAVLEHAVTIIDPMLNPDGRARFVDWVNANRGGGALRGTTDPQDREHNQPWPGARTNRYLFDLNRDWLPLVHPESQGRMALWHAWRPQLSTDFHEMGGNATYFFQPGIPSRNNPYAPARGYALTARIAEFHAAALDRIGSLYYARESFDDYYLGKGSSYPDVQGSVGILFEQASSRALAAETVHGRLEYGATVRNQFATSLSSLEAAVALRIDLLRHMRDVYAEAPRVARAARAQAYVFEAGRYPRRAYELARMLAQHRIRVYDLAEPVSAEGRRFEAGQALVVPVDQPQAALIRGIFERAEVFEDSLFYDVSTWALPLAAGLPYAKLPRAPRLGAELAARPAEGRVVGGRASYAYLIPSWGDAHVPRAVYRLLEAGHRMIVLREPFEATVAGQRRAFPRGTLAVLTGPEADEAVHDAVAEAAREDGLEAFALATGLSVSGPDLGTPGLTVLEVPRVALAAGPGTGANAVGEVWHLLAERVGMPVSLVDLNRLAEADLGRYTTIVFAGRPVGLSEAALDRLRAWVRGGGVLVATEAGTAWAASAGLVSLTAREAPRDSSALAYADVAAARGAQGIGGAAFAVELDATHPLAFGLPERLVVFKQGTQAFDPSDAPGTNVARYAAAPLASGYASPANVRRIAGGAAMVAVRQGRGAVVVYDFSPAFRAYWRASETLLLNAVFFGRAF